MSAFMSAERLGWDIKRTWSGAGRTANEHEQNENGTFLPEMESSVSVALSYSLSSESVEEIDGCLGGVYCISPQTEKAQKPLQGFVDTTALSATNTHKQ